MKKFITQIVLWSIPFLTIIVIGVFLPTTPKATFQLFMASQEKDSLLTYTESPRIILIGGSNLSFGINSQLLKDELAMNPVNMGLNAGISLKYMMDSSLPEIQRGDIVVLVPEYHYYKSDIHEINRQMLYVTFDTNREQLRYLNTWQFFNLLPFLPKYALTKYNPMQYLGDFSPHSVYGSESYNQFGDAIGHWGKESVSFSPLSKLEGEVQPGMMKEIRGFAEQVNDKDGLFFISYPTIDATSYNIWMSYIHKIEKMILAYNLPVLGTPRDYLLNDSLFYDSAYHLTKDGADIRTKLLIKDLQIVIK
jgi:hypothetical protein